MSKICRIYDFPIIMQPPTQLTPQRAHEILTVFNGLKPKEIQSSAEQHQVQAALLRLARDSDYQILGILADTFEQGQQTLHSYATALTDKTPQPLQPISGPIYIKFNSQSDLCYVEPYTGEYRGVLVSYQSADDSRPNQMYGHFPWNLFLSKFTQKTA